MDTLDESKSQICNASMQTHLSIHFMCSRLRISTTVIPHRSGLQVAQALLLPSPVCLIMLVDPGVWAAGNNLSASPPPTCQTRHFETVWFAAHT